MRSQRLCGKSYLISQDHSNVHADDIFEYALKSSLPAPRTCYVLDINPNKGPWSQTLRNRLRPQRYDLAYGCASSSQDNHDHRTDELGTHEFCDLEGFENTKGGTDHDEGQTQRGDNGGLVVTGNLTLPINQNIKTIQGLANMGKNNLRGVLEMSLQRQLLFRKSVRMLLWMNAEDTDFMDQTIAVRGLRNSVRLGTFFDTNIVAISNNAERLHELSRSRFLQQQSQESVAARSFCSQIDIPVDRRIADLKAKVTDFDADVSHAESELARRRCQAKQQQQLKHHNIVEELRQIDREEMSLAKSGLQGAALQAGVTKLREARDKVKMPLSERGTGWEVLRSVDEIRAFEQDPPLLAWDNRPYEPLIADASEFESEKPMALVDFRPRLDRLRYVQTVSDLLCWEHVVRHVSLNSKQSVQKTIAELCEGDPKVFMSAIPGLQDPCKGGSFDLSQLRMRTLPYGLILELSRTYRYWPFRKSDDELRSAAEGSYINPLEVKRRKVPHLM